MARLQATRTARCWPCPSGWHRCGTPSRHGRGPWAAPAVPRPCRRCGCIQGSAQSSRTAWSAPAQWRRPPWPGAGPSGPQRPQESCRALACSPPASSADRQGISWDSLTDKLTDWLIDWFLMQCPPVQLSAKGQTGQVSNLVFYTQSTITVVSGQNTSHRATSKKSSLLSMLHETSGH